jgi:hypothetical protein
VVRKVSAAGVITRVAGTGTAGNTGDDGPATAAQLSSPGAVAMTADGGFLIAAREVFRRCGVSSGGWPLAFLAAERGRRLAAPPGRSSSLHCGRCTWTCGCAVGTVAATGEWPALPGAPAGLAGALRGDEPQHVGGPDLIRRLGHHGEEHLQVIGGRSHRVRPAPATQELQVRIGQRHPDPGDQRPGAVTRTDRIRIPSMHCRLPTSQTTKPVKDGRNEKEDHRHNMQMRMFSPAQARQWVDQPVA